MIASFLIDFLAKQYAFIRKKILHDCLVNSHRITVYLLGSLMALLITM